MGRELLPRRGAEGCIEYTSLINIRPSAGNRGMVIEDPAIRAAVRETTFAISGRGEAV